MNGSPYSQLMNACSAQAGAASLCLHCTATILITCACVRSAQVLLSRHRRLLDLTLFLLMVSSAVLLTIYIAVQLPTLEPQSTYKVYDAPSLAKARFFLPARAQGDIHSITSNTGTATIEAAAAGSETAGCSNVVLANGSSTSTCSSTAGPATTVTTMTAAAAIAGSTPAAAAAAAGGGVDDSTTPAAANSGIPAAAPAAAAQAAAAALGGPGPPGRWKLPTADGDLDALAELLSSASRCASLWSVYGLLQCLVLLLLLGQLLASWSFQSRLGIITRTIISSLPQIAHLILVFLITLALYSCLLALVLGPRAAAASSYGSAWYDMLMGLLGGSSLVLPEYFLEGLAQSRAQALAVGLIYYSREFIFVMILMQFFMATIGGVFYRMKMLAIERLAVVHGREALGAWVGLKYRVPAGLAAGGIPWDVRRHVLPELLGAARKKVLRLPRSSVTAAAASGGAGGRLPWVDGPGRGDKGLLRGLKGDGASSGGSREASTAGLLQQDEREGPVGLGVGQMTAGTEDRFGLVVGVDATVSTQQLLSWLQQACTGRAAAGEGDAGDNRAAQMEEVELANKVKHRGHVSAALTTVFFGAHVALINGFSNCPGTVSFAEVRLEYQYKKLEAFFHCANLLHVSRASSLLIEACSVSLDWYFCVDLLCFIPLVVVW